MIQNCFALRPGTIFGFRDKGWVVTRNDTLAQRFTAQTLDTPYETKTFRYPDSKEISIRSRPFNN